MKTTVFLRCILKVSLIVLIFLVSCNPTITTTTLSTSRGTDHSDRNIATPLSPTQKSTIYVPTKTALHPTAAPTLLRTSTSTPKELQTDLQAKEQVLVYTIYPGDGGWCMANYLGWTAPVVVLYSDNQLLIHNSNEDPWYLETWLTDQQTDLFLQQIEDTGLLNITGDGSLFEDDPIYRFPANFEQSMGAGTMSLKLKLDQISKRISIYIPYWEYVVPEISGALRIIKDYQPRGMLPYQPNLWVGWVEFEDPCEPYQLEYKPWPNGMPGVNTLLQGGSQQLVFENTEGSSYEQLFGNKPDTYLYEDGNINYYIFVRPLLPHEVPTDFGSN